MFKYFTDHLGNNIQIKFPVKKVVSLVPSQTELLFDLGLDEQIIGITKFCIHPREKCRTKIKVGGTKNFDIEKISALEPDLIIANKEENIEEGITTLQQKFPVWVSDIKDLYQSLLMIQTIGEITERVTEAYDIAFRIKKNFDSLQPLADSQRVAYFIWRDPYMSVGNDTFIHDMLIRCGLVNVFSDYKRYPVITKEILEEANPEIILLSSEPYPFSGKHIDEFQKLCPGSKIILVDGEYFSWYGSRLLGAVEYFKTLALKL